MFANIIGQIGGALIGGLIGKESGGDGASAAAMNRILEEVTRRRGIESDVIAMIKNARNVARVNAKARMADLAGVLGDSQEDRAKALGGGFAAAGYRETDSPVVNAMTNAQVAFDKERLALADNLYSQELQSELGMAGSIVNASSISATNLNALGGTMQAASQQDANQAKNTAAFASFGSELASQVDWGKVFK